MALDIKGDSFAGRYKRRNYYGIDPTDTWDTYDQALIYARNTDEDEEYVPYVGQIVTVRTGGSYQLVEDPSVTLYPEREHYKLVKLNNSNDNDDRYLRRDIAETVQKLMTFLEGINVKGMATLEEITLLRNIVSQNFSAGSTGFGIYRDEDGNYHLDIDFVNIRRKLTADEIQVQQSSYIGGKQWNTAAGMICSAVEDKGTYWRCYFKTTDAEGRTVRNTFEKDDQAICETFNLDKQASGVLGNHYYWRLVANKPGDDYIDLSKSDCDTGSDAPQVGDNIVQLGNRTDASRQGAICWDSVTAGGPYVRVYKGINSYHLPQPSIDLNPEESVIKAKLVSEATGKDVDTALGEIQGNLDIIKQQTDKEYTIWFYEYVPTLSNIPASEWTTNALKTMHERDMFYNRESGLGYRFIKSGDIWEWANITDQHTLKALENAAKAQDTADRKRQVFAAQPAKDSEYDVGDLWVNATYSDANVSYENDILVCKIAKVKGAAFSIDHWKPSSTATTAYLENMGDRILAGVTESAEGIEAVRKLAQEGIDEATGLANDAIDSIRSAISDIEGLSGNLSGLSGRLDIADDAIAKHTTAIQATKDDIALLAKGIHFDASGKITNINTSGLVTTDDFNVLLSKKVNFDSGGHVTNISTSGLVTEAGFVKMFDARADANGYVKSGEISLFITEDDTKRLISNAVINADQIRFNGNIVANGTFFVDVEGNLTLNDIIANNITANSGVFKGDIIQGDGVNRMNADGSVSFANGKISWGTVGIPLIEGKIITASGGKRIEVNPEDNKIYMYNEKGHKVLELSFLTSSRQPDGTEISKATAQLYDLDSDGNIISYSTLGSDRFYAESQQFAPDKYVISVSPFGIEFKKNGTVTKNYPKE